MTNRVTTRRDISVCRGCFL